MDTLDEAHLSTNAFVSYVWKTECCRFDRAQIFAKCKKKEKKIPISMLYMKLSGCLRERHQMFRYWMLNAKLIFKEISFFIEPVLCVCVYVNKIYLRFNFRKAESKCGVDCVWVLFVTSMVKTISLTMFAHDGNNVFHLNTYNSCVLQSNHSMMRFIQTQAYRRPHPKGNIPLWLSMRKMRCLKSVQTLRRSHSFPPEKEKASKRARPKSTFMCCVIPH